MQIDQMSQLMQLNAVQGTSNTGSSRIPEGTDSSFSMMLEDMLQNMANQNSTNTSQTTSTNIGSTQDQKSKVSGLDNITLQSQKLAQTFQLQTMENMLTTSGSIGGSDDDNASIGSSSDSSQLLNTMLQSIIENENQNAITTNKDLSSSASNTSL
jgi:hypothetical protein